MNRENLNKSIDEIERTIFESAGMKIEKKYRDLIRTCANKIKVE